MAYVSNPQNSLREIVIYASQVKQGEIDLSGNFEGGWERLAHFPKSGISGRIAYIKSRYNVDRQNGQKDQRQSSALGNTDVARSRLPDVGVLLAEGLSS